MTNKEIQRFLSSGLFIAVLLTAGLLGNCAADQSYNNPNYSNAPQTAQSREELFKAIQNMDNKTVLQATPNSKYPYEALQNPYAFKDPQAALEQANTYRETQKLNSIYQSSLSEDNWYYWANLWQNWPQT
jgi:hypothetical protein